MRGEEKIIQQKRGKNSKQEKEKKKAEKDKIR